LTTTTTAILCFLGLFLVAMVILFVWIGARTGWPSHVVKLGIAVVVLLALSFGTAVFFSFAYAPRSITVSDEVITVERVLSPITVEIADITVVRKVAPEEFKGTIRTMGSDGLFARIGRFHSPALGNYRMYLTNGDDAVLIDSGERLIVSPEGSERFIVEVLARNASITPPTARENE
jgi:hypothetical protein